MKKLSPTLALAAVFVAACSQLSSRSVPLNASVPSAPLPLLVRNSRVLDWPSKGNSPGLEELDRIIGDAQIVMLGEPWHGDGAAIRLRSEIVAHLHEKLGFDVLVFESDFFGVARGWEKAARTRDVGNFSKDDVYPFWAITPAASPLWDHIGASLRRGSPLDIAGIDPKHVGADSRRDLPIFMDSLLSARTTVSGTDRVHFRQILTKHLANDEYRPDSSEARFFYSALDAAQESLDLLLTDRASFAMQEVRNLRASADYAWRGGSRDRAMGDNLAWLATQRYPGRRIIVWAHNNHIAMSKWMYFAAPDTAIKRSVERRSVASNGRFTYMGVEAKNFFGPRIVSIATLSYAGRYSPDVRTNVDTVLGRFEEGNFDSLATLVPAPAGTVEAALANAGFALGVVNLRPLRATGAAISARVFDYTVSPPYAMRYWEGYDAFLFIRSTFGLNESVWRTPRP
jgi:erythromycin esterase-like protein